MRAVVTGRFGGLVAYQSLFWLLVVLAGGILLLGLLAPRYWQRRRLEHEIARLSARRAALAAENDRLRLTMDALAAGRPEVWRLYIRQRLRYTGAGYRLWLDHTRLEA